MNINKARKTSNKFWMLPLLVTVVLFPVTAFAQDSGNELMEIILGQTSLVPKFLSVGAYVIAIWFAITGLVGLKSANESGGRSPLRSPLFRLLIGGFFLSLGALLTYLVETVAVNDAAVTGSPSTANVAANTLGGMMQNTMSNIGIIPFFLSAIAYFSAIFFAISGLLKLQDYIEDPSRNQISTAIMRLFGAGFLLTLPTVVGVVINTFGGNSDKTGNCFNGGSTGASDCGAWSVNAVSGNGFDAVLANIVNNIAPPLMQYALPAFCYFVGIIFVAVCLYRLAIASSDASRAPGSFGTFVTLFVGAAFLSFAHMIAYTRGTIFDTGTVYNQMQFVSSNPMDPQMQARAIAAFTAVLVFLRIVGYISFARGLFILRAFGEGRSGGSIMGAVTHIIAGGMLANLGALLNAVQNTTGIKVFDFV